MELTDVEAVETTWAAFPGVLGGVQTADVIAGFGVTID